jgi:hypothetical protein
LIYLDSCAADEKLIAAIRESNPTNSNVCVFMDARPYKVETHWR